MTNYERTGGRYSKASYSLNDMCRMVSDYVEQCENDAREAAK